MNSLHFFLFILSASPFFLHSIQAGLFDYPNATLSSHWTNNFLLKHNINYTDGSMIRAILLRGSYGPSFACGFYCTGTCDSFLFAIFIVYIDSGALITMPSLAFPQVVWSANRDHLVKENATLDFSADGNLVLRDFDGTFVWSTNTSGRSVVGLNLTETGELVLLNKNNASVWSSIDHPTDSWVIGQTLRQGQRLTANVSASNWTQGQLYLDIVDGGFATYADSSPPQLYYENRVSGTKSQNKSTYITFTNGSLAIFALFTDPGKPDSSVSIPQALSLQYMRLESDGHLRLYEWGSSGWELMGDVFHPYPDDCAYPTVCGEYGICLNGQCSCPSGDATYFRHVNPMKPNLGCSPVTPLSCQSKQNHQLLTLSNISYFNYIDSKAISISGTSVETCKEACLRNCSCKAALFQFGGNASYGSCYLPSQLFTLKDNDPTVTHYNSSAYIKVVQVPSPGPPNIPIASNGFKKKNKVSIAVIVGSTIGAVLAASIIICLIVLIRRKTFKRLEEEDQFDIVGIPGRFSFEELKIATENFCIMLGKGGFGSVFEGTLVDGTKIAVKRLDGVGQGKREFLAEVETIGSIHHINLVRLVGFCAEKSYRLLVYEYMSNGSLDKWIFYKENDTVLDWKIRRRIIIDIAKGLSYLHEECRQKIAHLDIKPQNILLDEEFNAKVSDFGLSKLIDRDQSHVMTRMRGTPGYLAPEWLTSMITEKADIYSFGVVVMEIVCGRKNLDYSQPEESIHLISLLQEKVQENRLLDLIDNRSADMQIHCDEVIEIMRLSMWCLQRNSNNRPSMSTVVKVLEGSIHVESNIDYNFSNPAPFLAHNANNSDVSAPPPASVLSGPR